MYVTLLREQANDVFTIFLRDIRIEISVGTWEDEYYRLEPRDCSIIIFMIVTIRLLAHFSK